MKELLSFRMIAAMLAVGIGLSAAWHVLPALAVRDSPPLACQIAGGHWNAWTGWTCG